MRDGVGPAILVILGGICLTAFFLVLGAYFPRRVEQTRRAAEGSPGRSFLIGLVNAVFVIGLVLALQGGGLDGVVQVLAVVLGILATLVVAIGLTAMVQLTGERLFPQMRPVARTAAGSAVLLVACLTPYVGWFGLFPYVTLRGLGAFLLGWWTSRSERGAAA
jgi:hypothetical protein